MSGPLSYVLRAFGDRARAGFDGRADRSAPAAYGPVGVGTTSALVQPEMSRQYSIGQRVGEYTKATQSHEIWVAPLT